MPPTETNNNNMSQRRPALPAARKSSSSSSLLTSPVCFHNNKSGARLLIKVVSINNDNHKQHNNDTMGSSTPASASRAPPSSWTVSLNTVTAADGTTNMNTSRNTRRVVCTTISSPNARQQANVLRLDAPSLETLYHSRALLTVESSAAAVESSSSLLQSVAAGDNTATTAAALSSSLSPRRWFAVLECNSLRIHETTSLTLNLTTSRNNHHGDKNNQNDKENKDTASSPSSSSTAATTPTVIGMQVQVRLEGPHRAEIVAILKLATVWFQLIDTVVDSVWEPLLEQCIMPLWIMMKQHYLLFLGIVGGGSSLLVLPLLATALVLSPLVVILFFPIVLPLVIVMTLVITLWASMAAVCVASTRTGRRAIATHVLSPLSDATLDILPLSVQDFFYDTGRRPTPKSLLQAYLPTDAMTKLCISLLMDGLGSSSYLLPAIGESFDVVWCPLQTLLISAMYSDVSPNLTYVSLVEEFLPFTDVLPSATIGWCTEFVTLEKLRHANVQSLILLKQKTNATTTRTTTN